MNQYIPYILTFYVTPIILCLIMYFYYLRLDGKSLKEIKKELFSLDPTIGFIVPILNLMLFVALIIDISDSYSRNKKIEKPKKSNERKYEDLEMMLIHKNILSKKEIEELVNSASLMKKLSNKIKL